MRVKTYRQAGVDVQRGERLVDFLKGLSSTAVDGGIGGFASALELDLEGYRRPVLLSCTDGVGTKILVARALERYDTLGIDLVAMSVNDLVVCGAKPLLFLDYIACGRIVQPVLRDVLRGIVSGCETAGCRLAGGETAEMPDVYGPDDFDLAGFCVGVGEKDDLLPRTADMAAGDPIFGLPSSGIHSNGLSLARKTLSRRYWEELLTPTLIYAEVFQRIRRGVDLLGAAHITGGGLEANIGRILPRDLAPALSYAWDRPEVFRLIKGRGKIQESEMRRTFNLGIGLAFVVGSAQRGAVQAMIDRGEIDALEIGTLEPVRGEATGTQSPGAQGPGPLGSAPERP
jgi:phosphoribosylformylglycinamidine cyclo-ligase